MKVLGVGYGRTGTTSLAEALSILGYRTQHWDQDFLALVMKANRTGRIDLSKYDDLEALVDFPAYLFYQEFLERYPEMKLVLTVREDEDWFVSVTRTHRRLPCRGPNDHAPGIIHPPTFWYSRLMSFGTESIHKYLMLKRYREHNRRVMSEFSPDRLLVMNIIEGDGWEKLCPFLGREIPTEPFPWLNKTDRVAA